MSILFGQAKNFGIMLGTTYYNGDYNQFTPFNLPSVGAGILYAHDVSKLRTLRFQADYRLIKGPANHTFTSNLFNVGLILEQNFMPFSNYSSKKTFKSTPFFMIGGCFLFIPNTNSTVNLSIPVGLGFKYALSEATTLSVEWNYSITNTDIIDEPGIDVNNQKKEIKLTNDFFSFLGVTLRYNISYEDHLCSAYR